MPNSDGPKRIRSLDRGLLVVEHLSNKGLSTLADLRRATGLSNATLLRLLATLMDRGWVRRSIVEGQYELSHSLGDVLGAAARAHPLAELAGPSLMKMRPRQRGLPSDLCALLGPGKIEIVESTRLRGPLAPARTSMGVRPSMLLSAHGRAMLAFLEKDEFEIHIAALRNTCTRRERSWLESGQLEKELKLTRSRGFGLREDDYWIEHAFDPGPELGAIAVPILSGSGLHGTLSVLWLQDDFTLEEVLALGTLDDLRRASARIGVALDRSGQKAPRFAVR